MFQRGQDIKESLSLGKYSEISKKLKETMESVISGREVWSIKPLRNTYEVEPAILIQENKPDKGGGNNHKFYSYLVLNNFQNHSTIKEMVRNQRYSIEHMLREEGFRSITINYYVGSKPIRKAGFEYKKNGFLIEIVYAELRKK